MTIASISEAIHLLVNPNLDFNALISITDPNYGSITEGLPERFGEFYLKQEYDDIDPEFEKYYNFSIHDNIDNKHLPSKKLIEELIVFYQNVFQKVANPSILVHCHMGVSRSTATALLGLYLFYNDEELAAQKLVEIRRQSMPNGAIVRYIDEVLNTNLFQYAKKITEKRIQRYQQSFLEVQGI
jgi:predicted protein tyrosine phosphatase